MRIRCLPPGNHIPSARELVRGLWVKQDMPGTTRTRRWDAADYLQTEKDMAAHLEAAPEEGDAALVATALGLRFHAAASSRGE